MPLNASNGSFTLFYTVLATRFPAAENPLRIPKVLRKAAFYRAGIAWRTLLFSTFIDVPQGYPGWLP